MPITSSDTCDPESTSQLFTDSSSGLTVNIETALYQDMEKATTEISEDTEKSFTEENPPYFDEDIPGTSENVGYPNDLVDAQGSVSDPDKALNSSSEESE